MYIPSWLAPSMTVPFLGTDTGLPSISKLIICHMLSGCSRANEQMRIGKDHFPNSLHHASLMLDMVGKLVTKMLNHGAHGHGGRITQRTDGAPLYIVGNVVEQIQVFHPSLAGLDPVHHAVQPACAFPARGA